MFRREEREVGVETLAGTDAASGHGLGPRLPEAETVVDAQQLRLGWKERAKQFDDVVSLHRVEALSEGRSKGLLVVGRDIAGAFDEKIPVRPDPVKGLGVEQTQPFHGHYVSWVDLLGQRRPRESQGVREPHNVARALDPTVEAVLDDLHPADAGVDVVEDEPQLAVKPTQQDRPAGMRQFQLVLDDFLGEGGLATLPLLALAERAPDYPPVIGEDVDDVRQLADRLDHLHDRPNLGLFQSVNVVDEDDEPPAALA